MCTAITYKTRDHYFGRTLDLEYCYDEHVTVTPRNYELCFRQVTPIKRHYAIIGMASVVENYPLYYDAVNECGLSMAGLNFPGNAYYAPLCERKDNIAPFELIPWVLGQCENITEAMRLLRQMNLCKIHFNDEFPLSPMHWIVADKNMSITIEPMRDGLKIFDNPVGVLTNNPTFDYHMLHLCDYMSLTSQVPNNHFPNIDLKAYSRGMGAMGLPGDLSSASRFVRAAFVKCNSVSGDGEAESVSQFFHILGAVEQQRGCVLMPDGRYEITQYTSCMNMDQGIYYYTTYDNHCIHAVDLHHCNLDDVNLQLFSLEKKQYVIRQN